MTRPSDFPSAISVNALVFSGGEDWGEDDPTIDSTTVSSQTGPAAAGPSSQQINQDQPEFRGPHISTYVRIFEEMLGTVIKEEPHLFSDEEVELLATFAKLSYNARFLMVKLLLRKQCAWHRLDALKYQDELGSIPAIVAAIDELCQVGPSSLNAVKEEEIKEEQEVIDLTMDDDISPVTFQHKEAQSAPGIPSAAVEAEAMEAPLERTTLILAENERTMEMETVLDCLRVEELKVVAKQMQLKTNHKKDELIKTLLRTSSSQSTLMGFAKMNKGVKSKGVGYQQTNLPFGRLRSQQERLREIAFGLLVKCIRVNQEFFSIIHRANVVYFRLTQYTPDLLVAALLSRFKKRAYPTYTYERTKLIWPTRDALLEYEAALILEGQVDAYLGGDIPALGGRAVGSKTPAAVPLPTPVTPGNAKGKAKEKAPEGADEDGAPDVKPDSIRVRGARMVKEIFENVYPRWKALIKTKGEEDGRGYGLERFDCGHVLTRIVCKGSSALAILGEHERELEILEALLAQKRWRRGRRGKWHERRALVLSTHFPKDEATTERALDAVIEALEDPDTHIVYRPKLQRRLIRLESKLKLPVSDRHTCEGKLAEAVEVVFEALRMRHRAASLKLDRTGRNMSTTVSPHRNHDIKQFCTSVTKPVKPESSSSAAPISKPKSSIDDQKGKSIWVGRNGEELTVEALALQRYEEQGYKGVHCETRVIAMLFGLLFWDIIFTSIPGAFETPYQTAPLDIAEDSFYHSRKDLMEKRLFDIEAGEAVNIIQHVDSMHRASGTWCVGVRWDLFSSQDLVDIVTCIGGKALSVICRILCEDYASRGSGGPDLFLWNPEKGSCKFAEVKGPGDTLQENQRVGIWGMNLYPLRSTDASYRSGLTFS
ncbi:hypothetical protein HYDPIDRAFT_144969 [Hydnomerulius pinastri MD-312]|nr:hypothetical protein HYDPIDRAFT_144969 [Hydnomerulius pinastri MD-312]